MVKNTMRNEVQARQTGNVVKIGLVVNRGDTYGVRCYKCQQTGHYSTECKVKKRVRDYE